MVQLYNKLIAKDVGVGVLDDPTPKTRPYTIINIFWPKTVGIKINPTEVIK